MKLSPQQAPLYGECVLTVQLDGDDVCGVEEEEEAEFYLLFLGSTQRHLTSTLRVSQVSLQAVCPAHNVCEQVLVTLCFARPGGPVDTHSQESFRFVQDLALDMAHFLLDNTAPEEALLLDDEQIPLKECEKLDWTLALALRHLTPPHTHTLANTHTLTSTNAHTVTNTHTPTHTHTPNDADHEVETMQVDMWSSDGAATSAFQRRSRLLHLAATHGLSAVASFILQQPGGREVLSCSDARGQTPASVAASRGHHQLLEVFARHAESSADGPPHAEHDGRHFYPEGRVFQHHSGLDTYTLTFPAPRRREGEASESGGCLIRQEIEELRRLIQLHRDEKGKADPSQARGPGGADSRPRVYSNGSQQEDAQPPATAVAEEEEEELGEPAAPLQSREPGAELRAAPAATAHGARGRRNKRRTARNARRAAESPGQSGSAPQAAGGTARGSRPRGNLSAAEGEEARNQSGEARLARECANRKPVAVPTAAVTEKQEGGDREVEALIPEAETPTTETRCRDAARLKGQEAASPSAVDADGRDMGQEQSQDPGELRSDPADPGRPSSPVPTPPPGRRVGVEPEPARKTRWYNDEEDSDVSEAKSNSVWYDGDTQERAERREECEGSRGSDAAQLLGGGPIPLQPHAAGAPPAASHGPATAQRREVRRSQPEEEVGAGWTEGGGEEERGGGGETRSRKDSETADNQEDKHQDKDSKSRRRRKKKKSRRGGEATLSSASSLESPTWAEAPIRTAATEPEPEGEAPDHTGSPTAGSPAAPEPTEDKDTMHPPGQEGETGDGQGSHCHAEPAYSAPPLPDAARTRPADAPLSQPPKTKEQEENVDLLAPADLHLDPSAASVGAGGDIEVFLPAHTDLEESLCPVRHAAAAQTGPMESKCPEELPVPLPEPSEATEDSFLVEFPEQCVRSLISSKPLQPAPDPGGGPAAGPRPVCPAAGQRDAAGRCTLEGAEDVRGSGAVSGGESVEPRLETATDQPPEEKKTNLPGVGEEETGVRRSSEEHEVVSPTPPVEEDLQEAQRLEEELVATAVALVAIAVAKASFHVGQELASGDLQEAPASGPEEASGEEPSEEPGAELSSPVDAPGSPQAAEEEAPTEAASEANTPTDGERDSSEADANEAAAQDGRRRCPVVDTGQPAEALGVSDHPPPSSEAEGQRAEAAPRDGEDVNGGRSPTPAARAAGNVSEQDDGPTSAAGGGETPSEGAGTPTAPPCCDLTPAEELPVGGETSPPPARDAPDAPTFQVKGHEEFAANGVDVVDGWKERERKTRRSEAEESQETAAAAVEEEEEEETSQTEPDLQREAKDLPQGNEEDTAQIQRDKDVFYPGPPQHGPNPLTSGTAVDGDGEENGRGLTLGADLDGHVFKKPADPAPRAVDRSRGIRVSWPSADDGALPASSRLSWRSDTEDGGGGEAEGGGGGGEEEERKDQLPENPVSSAVLRASIRSLSPFRRHSWEPGRNGAGADMDVSQRGSLRNLSGEARRAKPPLHRRSMSWCPSNLCRPEQIDNRSYSLEGLEVERRSGGVAMCPAMADPEERSGGRSLRLDSQERGSLVSLTEEEQEGDGSSLDSQTSHQVLTMTTSCPAMFNHQTLTKSVSMVAIGPRELDASGSRRRISFSVSISPILPKHRHFCTLGPPESEEEEEEGAGRGGSFSSNSGSLDYSICEEEPGPLRSDAEAKGGPKISRTFSYLRSKMTKKGKEKEKEKRKDGERENKDKERRSSSHVFIPITPSPANVCMLCTKPLHNKEAVLCNNCGVQVHKSCRESLPACMKSKSKQQLTVAEATAPGSAVSMRSKSTSSASSVSSASSSSSTRERWSTATTPDDQIPVVAFPRRAPSIFNPHSNLAKSISTSNIAGLDDVPLRGLKFLSQSTDSLHQGSKVNASTESLTDEGTEMMDSQLMGEFEFDIKDLEADSWSGTVDKKFLKTLKKHEIERQDVIYELYQTEFHHVRTLKIMSEVYYKGIQKELQLDTHTLDKIFPVLDDLLETHTRFLNQLLEQKRVSSGEGPSSSNSLVCCVGDVLVNQFSGCCADRMKKVYGKFCSRHNEAVNLYKELHAKDKRFQAFIKKIMSSSIVRRLSIPECILLVTQRITKYPVLLQRILQHTKDTDEDHAGVSEALRCVKELITAVDSKVNEQEKKRRLREVHSRTDSKSIMRMKSGQMFAKEDLIRGRKLLHDGALQLKNLAGRLKDVQAMLLSDVLVFLQEKDQKYVFASLDQRSTVISLQNLIVREVANEERGLFLITAGTETPEMVEVLASSKEERNTWRAIIQDAMHCMEKDEDEGVPSETEEDRRQQENRVKEIRELLRSKDDQILSLLEEKVHIFRDLSDGGTAPDEALRERMLFRATPDDVTKGEPIIRDALSEVETLHTLVNAGGALGGASCGVPAGLTGGGGVGPVSLPRRAETFGGFDSHQMNISKNGEKEEGDESLDLRRTESDSVLKKGATASLQMLLKRNNEQVQQSVTHLHDLLISLQAVVVQQDSFIEEQRQALNERLAATSSRHSSSSSLSSCSSSRPSSLIEQEKHRSLERQRQEAANLQKQQAAHLEEKRRREREWELKERGLAEREERLQGEELETGRRRRELTEEREALQRRKEEYQRDLERLREAQRRLERDKEQLRKEESERHRGLQRTPSTTSEDSLRFHSSGSLDMDSRDAAEQPKEVELSSSAPTKEPFLRIGSKRMGKNFNPFSSSSKTQPQGAEKEAPLPGRLLKLTKPKDKKDKKKKKGGAGGEAAHTEDKVSAVSEPQNDGDIFFC